MNEHDERAGCRIRPSHHSTVLRCFRMFTDSDETIVLTDKGSGGFKALRANFAPDLVQFAFLRWVVAFECERGFRQFALRQKLRM